MLRPDPGLTLLRDYGSIYSSGVGNFSLTWQKVKDPCNAIPANCGQAVSGSITGAGQMAAYTFTGSAGDGITIRILKTSGTLSPYIELYNPNGTIVGTPTNKINATLTVTGGYTILVRDQFYLNTGNYLVLWQRMNSPCNAVAVDCGQAVTGSIGMSTDPPPWRFHTFTVSAGDGVSIRVANEL